MMPKAATTYANKGLFSKLLISEICDEVCDATGAPFLFLSWYKKIISLSLTTHQQYLT
jgi:hypothetical protein